LPQGSPLKLRERMRSTARLPRDRSMVVLKQCIVDPTLPARRAEDDARKSPAQTAAGDASDNVTGNENAGHAPGW
jgi:hypothetical protein